MDGPEKDDRELAEPELRLNPDCGPPDGRTMEDRLSSQACEEPGIQAPDSPPLLERSVEKCRHVFGASMARGRYREARSLNRLLDFAGKHIPPGPTGSPGGT